MAPPRREQVHQLLGEPIRPQRGHAHLAARVHQGAQQLHDARVIRHRRAHQPHPPRVSGMSDSTRSGGTVRMPPLVVRRMTQ